MTGLYIHIPFCVNKCHYCDFVITTSNSVKSHELFLKALEKEILHYRLFFEKTVFDTCYLGGGTPSVLSAEETNKLFDLIRKNFKFRKNAEVTCEVNPGDINEEKAKNYLALGVNRVSLGAQSFHDATLKRINRAHNAKDILDSFYILKKAGFKNINLDLILSLPGETLSDVKHSLSELLKLKPEHVSLYELTIEEKTVFGELFKKNKLKLPDEELQVKMLSLARQTLKEKGYGHYELLNYAKPGSESRHNRLYWANEEYLGLGPGAFSYFSGRRFRNSSNYEEYVTKIQKNDWSAFEEETLTNEKKEIESFLLALRLKEGAEIKRFTPLVKRLEFNLKALEEKKLLVRENGHIHLTGQGQFFAETVFTELAG